ncbi:hypothetical protein AB0L13_34845 [Saccharopolyspora shandongensis]|uniref:hypothetical protein n=1 Tax=Saccharopolyspora shandongensis TaxID=418495 RepID=UPI003440E3FB
MDLEALTKARRKRSRWTMFWAVPTGVFTSVFGEISRRYDGLNPDLVARLPHEQVMTIGAVAASMLIMWGFAIRSLVVEGKLRRAERLARTAEAEQRERETISDRIEKLTASLVDSRKLIDELAAEVQARTEALQKLKEETEETRRLAEMDKEAAEAVRKAMAREIQETRRQLERGALRQQLVFFVLGSLVVAIPIGVIGNFVFEWIK